MGKQMDAEAELGECDHADVELAERGPLINASTLRLQFQAADFRENRVEKPSHQSKTSRTRT